MSEASPNPGDAVASRVAERLDLDPQTVAAALAQLDGGAPVPYLARYRRVAVGGLDETALRAIRDEAEVVREMEQRREFLLRALSEREGVPEKLLRRLERCRDRLELEYLYEPYRPPRKTPGSVARERGLEPLADGYLRGAPPAPSEFVKEGAVPAEEDALRGAAEILAERFAADPEVRGTALRVIGKEGALAVAPAAGKEGIGDRYRGLAASGDRLGRMPPHRFLALRRAEREGGLAIRVEFPEERILEAVAKRFYPQECPPEAKEFLDRAASHAVRLLAPAVAEDALREAQARAEDRALAAYRANLHDLLMFPPAGARRVLGVDPAPRGLIPVAAVDERGEPLEHARFRLFDKKDPSKVEEAREGIRRMAAAHKIEMVAIGSGRGRQECEAFLQQCFEALGAAAPPIVVVSEVGLAGYASGPAGRADLPSLPVPARGAVSLARRLQDPLAELVKADLRQLGQIQLDIDPARLAQAQRDVAEHCVNAVGVDVNRAPAQQLAWVCGFTPSVARALVEHRSRAGPFTTRSALRELPFITPDTFGYGAGFLRIRDPRNPVAGTGVHPDHRPLVEKIAARLGVDAAALVRNTDRLADIVAEDFADEVFNPATVEGVLFELLDGGKDPRPPLEVAPRPAGVRTAADLKPGLELSGRVTNVTTFGAFIDLGVAQDGLVHVSELADHFVRDASSVARVGQVVRVRVLGVDAETGRISLSMKSGRAAPRTGERRERSERGGPRRDRGGPRPRRREEREEREEALPPPEPPRAPEPVAEETMPADISEEEFVKQRLEEIRRRFG